MHRRVPGDRGLRSNSFPALPLLSASTRRPALCVAWITTALLVAAAGAASALTAGFEDLGLGSEAILDGSTLAGGFSSGGLYFENDYNATYGSFSGFAASTSTDATTPGFGNQFGNLAGTGAGGSAGFGIGYRSARVILPSVQTVLGAEFNNTTYAGLSMRDGDAFAKQFGGASGSDPDFFRLLIEGIDASGASTGIVEFLLADYRFADDTLDYLIESWTFQDLSSLGAVKELRFGFESSDVGIYGINTPVYFAIDNLTTIPEPGSALLLGLGLVALSARRSSRR